MKLVRFGAAGKEKPGIIDKNGKIRDLSKVVKDIDGEALSPAGLAKIKKANIDKLPLVKGNPRLGPCVARPSNFIAIGLNYADHAAEAGMKLPPEPIIFNKALSLHLRAERQHHHAEGLDQARLRGRARHRDRQARQLPVEGARR